MKSVLASIRPQYCNLIVSGRKTLELRKTRPKLEPPFKGYIYCTVGGDALALPHMNDPHYSIHRRFNGRIGGKKMNLSERKHSDYTYANGNVIGEFICDWIKDFGFTPYNHGEYAGVERLYERSCLSFDEVYKYIGERHGFAWHISNLQVYEKPVPLMSFVRPGAIPIFDAQDLLCQYCEETEYGEHSSCITPNGYISCEGAFCEEAYQEYLYKEFGLTRAPQSWCYVEELII